MKLIYGGIAASALALAGVAVAKDGPGNGALGKVQASGPVTAITVAGPTGPTGPSGPTGPTGASGSRKHHPTGPTGPTGPAATSISVAGVACAVPAQWGTWVGGTFKVGDRAEMKCYWNGTSLTLSKIEQKGGGEGGHGHKGNGNGSGDHHGKGKGKGNGKHG